MPTVGHMECSPVGPGWFKYGRSDGLVHSIDTIIQLVFVTEAPLSKGHL